VHLDGVGLRKAAERDLGEGRSAVLHRAAQPIVDAGNLRQLFKRFEIDGDVGDRTVRQNDARRGRCRSGR
jgi:hypothetical protein